MRFVRISQVCNWRYSLEPVLPLAYWSSLNFLLKLVKHLSMKVIFHFYCPPMEQRLSRCEDAQLSQTRHLTSKKLGWLSLIWFVSQPILLFWHGVTEMSAPYPGGTQIRDATVRRWGPPPMASSSLRWNIVRPTQLGSFIQLKTLKFTQNCADEWQCKEGKWNPIYHNVGMELPVHKYIVLLFWLFSPGFSTFYILTSFMNLYPSSPPYSVTTDSIQSGCPGPT